MRRIPASICFVTETMAVGQGRQLQIDKKYVAMDQFFELILRIFINMGNISNFSFHFSAADPRVVRASRLTSAVLVILCAQISPPEASALQHSSLRLEYFAKIKAQTVRAKVKPV